MNTDLTFPVAETFYSIQGEGVWTGTPMFFIRLAGCNVGRYESRTEGSRDVSDLVRPFQILHPEYATCTSFAGEHFICDTDYRVKARLTIDELLSQIEESGAKEVVLTGGEPLIHKHLWNLVDAIHARVHIETSGTLPIPYNNVWITCAPKWGFDPDNIHKVDEWKFLVRNSADEAATRAFLLQHFINCGNIFIQPIDDFIMGGPPRGLISEKDTKDYADTFKSRNFAIDCVKRNPSWRLSAQLHKYLEVR